MKFPRDGTRQAKVAAALVQNHHKWKRVWLLDVEGISHHDFVHDIGALRRKGWPIEDIAIDEGDPKSRHSYRLDAERWKALMTAV